MDTDQPRHLTWTAREREVLDLLTAGRTNAEIAETLGISFSTAKWHVSELITRLGVTSREEVAAYWRAERRPVNRARRLVRRLAVLPALAKVVGTAAAAVVVSGAVVAVVLLRAEDNAATPAATTPPVATTRPSITGTGRSGVVLLDWPKATAGSTSAQHAALHAIQLPDGGDVPGMMPIDVPWSGSMTVLPVPGGSLVLLTAGEPLIVDSGAWISRTVGAGLGQTFCQAFNHDGSTMFALKDAGQADATGRLIQVWRQDFPGGATQRLGDLTGWSGYGACVFLSPDGKSLFVLMNLSSERGTNVLDGDPFFVMLDSATGAEQRRITLPGLKIGQIHEPTGYPSFQPGLVVSADRTRLYIAHPDEARLTVVDLVKGRVERTVPLERSASRLDRIGGWLSDLFASTAEAKGGNQSRKQVLATPDGRYLLITGTEDRGCQAQDDPCDRQVPIGLTIVDTTSFKILAEFDGIGEAALSPDGYTIAGASHVGRSRVNEDFNVVGTGLTFIDLRTLKVTAHVGDDTPLDSLVFDESGVYLLALSTSTTAMADGSVTVSRALDVYTLAGRVARREVGEAPRLTATYNPR